jgi:hypothetical protein
MHNHASTPGAIPESTHDGETQPMEIDIPPSERKTLKLRVVSDDDTTDKLADCRNQHAELKADASRWEALKFVGFSKGLDGDPDLELRNCNHCQSTVAKEL